MGWYESTDPNIANHGLTDTDSGLYYNDFHPLLFIDNLYAIKEENKDWATYLTEKTKASIRKLINRVFIEKKMHQYTKEIFKEIRLYDGVGNIYDKLVRESRFVGFEIQLNRSNNVVLNLDYIGWQFDTTQVDKDIYIYHSSQIEPLETFKISVTKENSLEWLKISNRLKYFETTHDVGGAFYIGYYEDDFVGQAIERKVDLSKPCGSCNRQSVLNYSAWSKWAKITPFYVTNGNLNGTQLWNPENNIYCNNTNFGLNFIMSANCDITDFICNHREMWNEVLGLQVAVDMLGEMAFSTRINRVANVSQDYILRELDGDNESSSVGMKKQLDKAIKAFDFDLSELDSPCMPCQKKGIRFGGI
jgi:hypothetical protein